MEMEMCRTCLKLTTTDDLLPLFDGGLLPSKIEDISSIKVIETEDLPSKVCTRCTLNINLAYNFRLLIIRNDQTLQDLLETGDKPFKHLAHTISVFPQTETSEHDPTTDTNTTDSFKSEELSSNEMKNNILQEENDVENEISNTSSIRRINRTKIYSCTLCEFTTTKYKQLYYHKSTQHEITKSVVCSICGKTLLAQNMKKHTLSHSSSPIACQICGNVCKNPESLRSHMMYHKGRERSCPICGKVYKHSSKFALHIRQHMAPKERKHRCHLCEKLFTDRETLKKHIRSHTGERPFPCDYCKKGFSSPYALKTHRRQHTKERPYACALCSMAFPQRVSLRTHLKSKHNIPDQKDDQKE